MELDITHFIANAGMIDYSASAAEIGQDAGAVTWAAAIEDSPEFPLLATDEQRDAFRTHVAEFGAWEKSEINAWSDIELNALCMQMVAGDVRESGLDIGNLWKSAQAWNDYYVRCEQGSCSGRLLRGADGKIYYYIGN